MVRVWPVDIRDPQFTYVRWCSDFEIVDLAGQQIIGAISKGGKEGHLSEREATAKVIRVMQQDLSADVARAIAAHVWRVRIAGCGESPSRVSTGGVKSQTGKCNSLTRKGGRRPA